MFFPALAEVSDFSRRVGESIMAGFPDGGCSAALLCEVTRMLFIELTRSLMDVTRALVGLLGLD